MFFKDGDFEIKLMMKSSCLERIFFIVVRKDFFMNLVVG